MTDGSNHINYTAADIERYWKGELSPPEQHAMEKAALDDPFLADAMEGYADAHQRKEVLKERLGELQNDLIKRINRKDNRSVVAFGWWRIAAMVVVIAGAGWLAIRLSRNNGPNEIAQEKVKKPSPAAVQRVDSEPTLQKADSTALVQIDSDTFNLKETASTGRTQPPSPPRQKTAIVKPESKKEPAAAVVTAEEAKDDETQLNEVVKAKPAEAEKKEAAPSAVAIGNANASAFDKRAIGQRSVSGLNDGAPNSNRFSASVVDKYNQPVPNVKVSIPAFNVETKTDKKGNFSFFAPDSIVNVNVSTGGSLPQFINLTKEATLNQITLDPYPKDRDKISAVADGKGIPVDSTKRITLQVLDAEPLAGYPAFQEYLAKNKRIPFGKKDVHGTVIVSFDVHPHSISNFEVVESLDDELDEEAIRLVKAGPGWRLLKGKKASIKLNIQF